MSETQTEPGVDNPSQPQDPDPQQDPAQNPDAQSAESVAASGKDEWDKATHGRPPENAEDFYTVTDSSGGPDKIEGVQYAEDAPDANPDEG